jgi:hypothetical protein
MQDEEHLFADIVFPPVAPPVAQPVTHNVGPQCSGSPEFDKLRHAFAQDPGLRQETEWALRLAVETYNPSDRGLRFITGAIGEWVLTLAAYRAGLVTLPDGHGADGHDTIDVLGEARALWSVKTSYKRGGYFTITNGQGGPGAGLVVPTVFLSPELPGVVFVHPDAHPEMRRKVQFGKDSTKLTKAEVRAHAEEHPECVIDLAMPTNPGAAVRDPALEAVKLLVDTVNFPRLREMFVDISSRSDSSLVSQIRDLKRLLEDGTLDEGQYRAAINRLTGAVS